MKLWKFTPYGSDREPVGGAVIISAVVSGQSLCLEEIGYHGGDSSTDPMHRFIAYAIY